MHGFRLEIVLITKKKSNTSETVLLLHYCFSYIKSEARMTASILEQDPNTWKVQKNAIY